MQLLQGRKTAALESAKKVSDILFERPAAVATALQAHKNLNDLNGDASHSLGIHATPASG